MEESFFTWDFAPSVLRLGFTTHSDPLLFPNKSKGCNVRKEAENNQKNLRKNPEFLQKKSEKIRNDTGNKMWYNTTIKNYI